MHLGGLWEGGIPPSFWQTKRYSGVFSTGTEKRTFAGFSGRAKSVKNVNGTRVGLVFSHVLNPLFHLLYDEGEYRKIGYPVRKYGERNSCMSN